MIREDISSKSLKYLRGSQVDRKISLFAGIGPAREAYGVLFKSGDDMLSRVCGVEVEWFGRRGGFPVDLIKLLLKDIPLYEGSQFGRVCRDAGPDQGESVTNPSQDPQVLLQELQLAEQVAREQGIEQLLYVPARPDDEPWAGSRGMTGSRFEAMMQGLKDGREGGMNAEWVYRIGDICATHYHFGGFANGVNTDEAVRVYNVLNLLAPTVAAWVHAEFGLESQFRNRLWKFASSERLPGFRWFTSIGEYVRYFESVLRLIRAVGRSGQFAKGLDQSQRFDDGFSDGVMWWATRLRPSNGTGTVEFRALPSLPPEQAVQVLVEVDHWLMEALVSYPKGRTGATLRAADFPLFHGRQVPVTAEHWQTEWFQY